MTKDPVAFLLQYLAWLMLIAVLAVTWAGVTYPSERAKGRLPTFTKIHPQCLNRIFIDPRYEGSVKLELCHAEFQKEPITVSTVPSILGDSKQMEVSATRIDKKRSKLDHHLPNAWTGTRGSISPDTISQIP